MFRNNNRSNNSNLMMKKLNQIVENTTPRVGKVIGSKKVSGFKNYDFDDFENEIENMNLSNKDAKKQIYSMMAPRINSIYGAGPFLRDNEYDNNMSSFAEAQSLLNRYDDKCLNYVAAILDPEMNYNTGIMVKQPSLLNPPSVTIPIKTLYTIPSETKSSICIAWNPSFFCTKQVLPKITIGDSGTGTVYADRICSVLYSVGQVEGGVETSAASNDAWVCGVPDNLPEVGVAKARLVSAKIKISFRGAIINQAGTIMAAATYLGPPGVVARADNNNYLYVNQDDANNPKPHITWKDLFKPVEGQLYDPNITPFDEKIISNGIWAKNVNITKDANGISAVFVPSDPMDEIFYKTGTFYGEDVVPDPKQLSYEYGTTFLYNDKGAKLSYLFNVQGLGDSNCPIVVETYTNWEVLPTSSAASTLRNSTALNYDYELYHRVKELLQKYFSSTTGIHTVSKDKVGGLWSKLKKLANKAWDMLE